MARTETDRRSLRHASSFRDTLFWKLMDFGSVEIPYARPTQWGRELELVTAAITSNWIGTGPFLTRLEEELAALHRVSSALLVVNGTAALHASYLALGLKPGDEVIFPGFGYMAGANVALQLGLVPVFCDVDRETYCLNAKLIEERITRRTRAVVPIHTYGMVCDMRQILDLASAHRICVIEDAAEALGGSRDGFAAGTRGDVGILSFHAAKTITTGEGGAVLTSSDEIAERVRQFRSHGSLRQRYFHDFPGHNFRMSNLHAAVGLAQLEGWESIIRERSRVVNLYREKLNSVCGVRLQAYESSVSPVVWAVAAELDLADDESASTVVNLLRERGVETRNGFHSATEHSIYGPMRAPIPTSNHLARTVISLPTYPGLTNENIDRVCCELDIALRRVKT